MKDSASGQTCEQARPETHQNLIHPDKDLSSGLTRGPASPPASQFHPEILRHRTINADRFRFSAIHSHNCTDHPTTPIRKTRIVVEVIGLEPTTPCLQSRCSPS
jgi:hypothetical protein